MLRNYFTVVLRNLLRDKLFASINIFGLAIALASAIMIGLYVAYEFSYDDFHPDANRLYRIMRDYRPADGSADRQIATNFAPVGPALQQDFSAITEMARLLKSPAAITRDDLSWNETEIYYVDPSLFRLFAFVWLQGDPATALEGTNSAVVAESQAKKYFGTADALGKTLRVGLRDVKITGVFRDLPANSHLAPVLIRPISIMFTFLGEESSTSWQRFASFHTYVKLAPGAAISDVVAGLPAFLDRHVDKDIGKGMQLTAIAVPDIHLHSQRELELGTPGNMATLLTMATVAIGIVLIACFNFMNIATARAMLRGKEVGVRKVVGAGREHLVWQFMSEALFMVLLATLLAMGLVELALPAYSGFAGKPLGFGALGEARLLAALLALVLVVSGIAGCYPAFYLSGFKPARVLRNSPTSGRQGLLFRNLLVILQFTISIVMVAATAVVMLQNRYAHDLDPGFDKEQVVALRMQFNATRWDALKKELLHNQDIVTAAASSQLPATEIGTGVAVSSALETGQHDFGVFYIDHGFFGTYHMAPTAGRLFSEDFPADMIPVGKERKGEAAPGNFIINETAVHEMGWTLATAVNQQVNVSIAERLYSGRIVGVVADSHFESLRHGVKPLIFMLAPSAEWGTIQAFGYVSLRLSGHNVSDTLAYIDRTWRSLMPESPVNRWFLSDRIAALYQDDERLQQLFSSFATLALVIACLGLFGLATFNAQRRMKEIGVRKVMGGSVWSIVLLLTNDFSKLVLISNVIAWPLAYYAMQSWLQNFAYRITLTPLIFVGSGLIALCIAWVTVGGTAAKAANQKPVLALRYE